ncbi:uncharacterized protein EDB91DRAFT_1087550 [Suillus paluster]|uniref:uncharacterized protein n=1 Tax=Suillus paluster TaxID=48578 RepID=UPI001B877C54|nr:uncharacterized protein EDB91DRAFT_1087550 [Suillus paluster]KAG1724208.1 hypothetical protein EDB91DRAFT_1087550 [Suillus paluster]
MSSRHRPGASSSSSDPPDLDAMKHEDSKTDDTELYQNAGRKASSLLDTFGVPSAAFKTGLQFDRGGKRDLKQSNDVTDRHLLLYNGIINYIPGLESELDDISSKKLNMIIAMVSKGMSDGRSADLSSIKHNCLQYIGLNMYSKANALDPPIPEVEDKSMRGLNHPQLAHLLCPRKKLDWFDEDPDSAMAALQAGEITMTAYNWPIKTVKKSCVGLTAVNKYIIAYIHVITYFTISSAQHRIRYIGDMDLDKLLWAIVEMLDDDEDPWVKDTLTWWNRHLKPTKENSNLAKLMQKESENNIAQICAQRAAHHSALVPSHPVNPSNTQDPSMSGKHTRPAEHHDKEDIPPCSTMAKVNPPLTGWATVPTYQVPAPCHPEFDAQDHTPPPHKLKSKCLVSDAIDYEQEALPPKFKAQYSTEATGYDVAPASMQAGRPTLDCDGEEQQSRPCKQQHPATSVHHDDEDQPPCPKPKPKPKPRHTAHEHEDSISKLVTEQLGMTGSWPAPAPSPHPSSQLSDLTDYDFPPEAANLFDAPLAPSKQKGKKKAITALDAPRRTSG